MIDTGCDAALNTFPSAELPPYVVRPLQLADLDALMAIQRACYGEDFVEGREVFVCRLASSANCSLVAERGGELLAYLAAYWSVAGKVTPLHGDFDTSHEPNALYLHDMAVHPAHVGQGLAQRLLTQLWEQALRCGIQQSSLVSVQGSQDYWRRQGYAEHGLHNSLQLQRLASYGSDAIYMQRLLHGDGKPHVESGDNVGYA